MNYVLIVVMGAAQGLGGGQPWALPAISMTHFTTEVACRAAEREVRYMANEAGLRGKVETRCMPTGAK
jgi:hypothetical protein